MRQRDMARNQFTLNNMIKFIKRKIKENKSPINKHDKRGSTRPLNIAITILLLVIVVLFFFFIFREKNLNLEPPKNKNNSVVSDSSGDIDGDRRLIDGRFLEDGEKVDGFLIATIIDNHPDARPALGLSSARVVYDIPAEGGINRYLAIFSVADQDELEIGPIRSARPYFLDIAREYGTLLVHCGGSPEALARISKEKLLSFNEFYNEKYFYRHKQYSAPHNVVLSVDLLKNYLDERNYNQSVFSSWQFKDKEKISDLDLFSASFDINVSNGQKQYEVDWHYDLEKNTYFRSLAGKKQVDASGQQITADNLIFQKVVTEILDGDLRLKIDLDSGGEAVMCLDGFCYEVNWRRDEGRIKYFDQEGGEVIFNAGQTWIHFIDKNTALVY